MDSVELFKSAGTAIRTNKVRSFLTTLGIVIGVGSVILLVSIGSGLQGFVTKQFEALGSNILFVLPGKVSIQSSGGRPLPVEPKFTFDDVREISKMGDPITKASGAIAKTATVKYLQKTDDVTLEGVDESFKDYRNIKTSTGQFITKNMVERAQMVAVLGPKVVDKLFRSGENPVGKEVDLSGKKMTIVGVTESQGGGFGNTDTDNFVYIPVSTAQKITGQKAPATIIVQTTSPDSTALAATKVKQYFYRHKLTDDDFTILEPKEILAQINTFLGAITAALSGIAAISLVVGGIGIANIMLVSVTERIREIGLRKALGATKRDILLQFLIEAVVLSLLGGGIGIAIGWGLSELLKRFIETTVTLNSVMLAFGISALVGIVSGVGPAIRAANLDPITALRYE